MHRDKKVGLALAILLCSIVGAFFFRDDAPRSNGPELKDSQKLDQEIAHKGREPYQESNSRRATERSRSGFDPNDLPDFLRDGSSPGQGTTPRNRVNGSRDPLFGNERNPKASDLSTLAPPPQDAPAVPIPLHNSEWDVASNDSSTARRGGGPRGRGVLPGPAARVRQLRSPGGGGGARADRYLAHGDLRTSRDQLVAIAPRSRRRSGPIRRGVSRPDGPRHRGTCAGAGSSSARRIGRSGPVDRGRRARFRNDRFVRRVARPRRVPLSRRRRGSGRLSPSASRCAQARRRRGCRDVRATRAAAVQRPPGSALPRRRAHRGAG